MTVVNIRVNVPLIKPYIRGQHTKGVKVLHFPITHPAADPVGPHASEVIEVDDAWEVLCWFSLVAGLHTFERDIKLFALLYQINIREGHVFEFDHFFDQVPKKGGEGCS